MLRSSVDGFASVGSATAPTSSPCPSPSSSLHQFVPFAQSADLSFFSADQVTCICQCLENFSNFSALSFFVERIEKYCVLAKHPSRDILQRAKALSLFHRRQFGELFTFIRLGKFSYDDHPFLQRLWNDAHYAEVEQMRGKQLDPVSRYRIRKKNGFPRSIWDGESTSYCFKRSARQILRETYRRQNTPSQEEKVRLSRMTQLSTVQVSNWFKNQRQRARQNREKEQKNVQKQKEEEEGNICSSAESDGTMDGQ